jgi:uncharacterized protein
MPQQRRTRRAILKACAGGAISLAVAGDSDAVEVVPLRGAPARKPVAFKSGGQNCYGYVHTPGTSFGRSPGVLFVHGLVDAAPGPHRMFVTMADALAASGFTSLRFDLRGRGDSDGESIDITPRRDLEDATNALQLLREQPNLDTNNLTLIGYGWGGVIAAMLSDAPGVKRTVLLAAAPPDREVWKVPPVKEYNGRKAADVSGNLIAQTFFDAAHELEPMSALKKGRRPVLLVRGTRDERILPVGYERFVADLRFAEVQARDVPIDGADHAFTTHDWERQAVEAVVGWVRGA